MTALFNLLNAEVKNQFEGHDLQIYDMDDALYIEDATTGMSYTYSFKTKKLIIHDC